MVHYDRRGLVIRDARAEDIPAVAADMREPDAAECRALAGLDPLQALSVSYAKSSECMTVELGGLPVAMFGIVPVSILGSTACVWFLGGHGLARVKKSFVKLSRPVIEYFLSRSPVLAAVVDLRYQATVLWLRHCGAASGPAFKHGPEGRDFALFQFRRA